MSRVVQYALYLRWISKIFCTMKHGCAMAPTRKSDTHRQQSSAFDGVCRAGVLRTANKTERFPSTAIKHVKVFTRTDTMLAINTLCCVLQTSSRYKHARVFEEAFKLKLDMLTRPLCCTTCRVSDKTFPTLRAWFIRCGHSVRIFGFIHDIFLVPRNSFRVENSLEAAQLHSFPSCYLDEPGTKTTYNFQITGSYQLNTVACALIISRKLSAGVHSKQVKVNSVSVRSSGCAVASNYATSMNFLSLSCCDLGLRHSKLFFLSALHTKSKRSF